MARSLPSRLDQSFLPRYDPGLAHILRQRTADRLFEQLYNVHVGDVYRYSLGLTGNPADAEDVAQTTFMNAYRALADGERPLNGRAWLIAIAHNVCRQRFRHEARRPSEVVLVEELVEELVPDDRAPTAGDIQRALSHLAPSQREALVMRELEGRSYAEIARTLELTIPAVESAIFRARRALREQMETSLTCDAAEASISLQIDGRLPRSDRGALRAHLRECPACRTLAKRQRAQRHGWKAFAALPVPSSLSSLLGGGAGIGAGVGLKVAVATTAVVAGGSAFALAHHATPAPSHGHPPTPAHKQPTVRPQPEVAPAVRVATTPVTTPHVPAHAGATAPGKKVADRVRSAHPTHPVHPAHPTTSRAHQPQVKGSKARKGLAGAP